MFEPVEVQVEQHKAAIQRAYKQGYDSPRHARNPYSSTTQSSRYHAFVAGRFDRDNGFAYEEMKL